MALKDHVPWRVKVVAKIALARLPVRYAIWNKLNIFRHGPMQQPAYALEVFCRHFDRRPSSFPDREFVALELGPGNSLLSGLIAHGFGAARTYLVDVGPFADRRVEIYRYTVDLLHERGLRTPPLARGEEVGELLAASGTTYLTEGIDSLRSIPGRSVDFAWSHAVLEHVRRQDFLPMMTELRRVLRPQGFSTHTVDFEDHFNGALNNLRFSESRWESDLMARSGFYTNRIRYREMLSLFEQAGFAAEVVSTARWDRLPTPRRKLHPAFRELPEDDLLVHSADIVLRAA